MSDILDDQIEVRRPKSMRRARLLVGALATASGLVASALVFPDAADAAMDAIQAFVFGGPVVSPQEGGDVMGAASAAASAVEATGLV
jgi:hypothetical protein